MVFSQSGGTQNDNAPEAFPGAKPDGFCQVIGLFRGVSDHAGDVFFP